MFLGYYPYMLFYIISVHLFLYIIRTLVFIPYPYTCVYILSVHLFNILSVHFSLYIIRTFVFIYFPYICFHIFCTVVFTYYPYNIYVIIRALLLARASAEQKSNQNAKRGLVAIFDILIFCFPRPPPPTGLRTSSA